MTTGTFKKTYNVQPNESQRATMNSYLKSTVEGAMLCGYNVEVITHSGKTLNIDNNTIVVNIIKTKGYKTFQDSFKIGPRGGMASLR